MPKKKCSTYSLNLSSEIKNLLAFRNRVHRLWLRNRSDDIRLQVKSINKVIRSKICILRNKNWNSKISNLEYVSNQFWKTTKIIKNKLNMIPPLKNVRSNEIIYSNVDKAELIGSAFQNSHLLTSNYSDQNIDKLVSNSLHIINNSSINFNEIKRVLPSEIKNLIIGLKNKKAPGHDFVNNCLLKHFPKKAIVLLTVIFRFGTRAGARRSRHARRPGWGIR